MLKSISFKKLAVLTAGLAIVLSSCGLQNSASESSDDTTAAGKTKNYALATDGTCWDNMDSWNNDLDATVGNMIAERGEFPGDLTWNGPGAGHSSASDPEYAAYVTAQVARFEPSGDAFYAEMTNGEPCPAGTLSASADSSSGGSSSANKRSCLPQALIDSGVAGFTEQINKDFPADWSQEMIDKYKAEMQRGIDALKGTCVSK